VVAGGGTRAAVAAGQPELHDQTVQAAITAFVAALNDIMLIGAIVLFAGAVLALALVRRSDFVDPSSESSDRREPEPLIAHQRIRPARRAAAPGSHFPRTGSAP
jgi:hypothetical protein